MNFIIEHWVIEAVVCISTGIIVAYGLFWLFDECNKEH